MMSFAAAHNMLLTLDIDKFSTSTVFFSWYQQTLVVIHHGNRGSLCRHSSLICYKQGTKREYGKITSMPHYLQLKILERLHTCQQQMHIIYY